MTRFSPYFRATMLALLIFGTGVIAPLTLTGCAALGVRAPANFDQSVVAGYKSIETVADLVVVLHGAGKLDDKAANAALDRAQDGADGIAAAAAFRRVGDFSQASTRLSAATAALELLLAELRARQ